ncbi:MAG: hypothetical protein AAFO76_04785 [Cyanobacteria bacterium J06607_15]
MAQINIMLITPPEINVIRPIPLSTYRAAKPIKEKKKTLNNMVCWLPILD